MTDIETNAFIGAGDADSALAEFGISTEVRARGNGISVDEDDPGGEPTGSGPLFGDSVRTVKVSTAELSFNPQYVCAVYIRYEKNGRPNIRHAYKALSGPKTDEEIRDIAEYILQDLRDDEYHTDVIHVRKNFRGFTMMTQQVVVLFLDNDPAIIRMNDDSELENLIRFSAFGGVPPYTQRKKNFAFYNLQRIRLTKDVFDCNTAYRVDFWNIDETGALLEIDSNTAPEDHYVYSMNIHLLQAPYEPDEVTAIPVILDPDTGNMGAEP
ncbi:MAG TPA: hypothetical protein VEW26_07560 [Allosphingosinicella sp.]|nr:hypothetical protein [Allosphingosinicella sp.]